MSDIIIFHGGCHGCTRQQTEGVEYCVGCKYFDANWYLPDLCNAPKGEPDIEQMRANEKRHNAEEKEKYGIKIKIYNRSKLKNTLKRIPSPREPEYSNYWRDHADGLVDTHLLEQK